MTRACVRALILAGLTLAVTAAPAGATGILYAIDEGNGALYSIDPDTPALSLLGIVDFSGEAGGITGLAWDVTRQRLVGTNASELYEINIASLAATLIDEYNAGGSGGTGLEYIGGAEDRLYVTSPYTKLRWLNAGSGAPMGAADLTNGNPADTVKISGLAFDTANDRLVGFGHTQEGETIYTIDRDVTPGLVGVLYNTDVLADAGMAFDPINDVYWTFLAGLGLYKTDLTCVGPSEMCTTAVITATDAHPLSVLNIHALAYRDVSSVPEPGTLTLVAAGILALGGGLRRPR